jgi:hypothetical protein
MSRKTNANGRKGVTEAVMLIRRSLLLFAASLALSQAANAQWTLLSGSPGGEPRLQIVSGGIVDDGRRLQIGSFDTTFISSVDNSGQYAYGADGFKATRWGFDGVVDLHAALSDATLSQATFSTGTSVYGFAVGESGLTRPVLWNGTTAVELLSEGQTTGNLNGFNSNQAAGWVTVRSGDSDYNHAVVWNGSQSIDLHQSGGLDPTSNSMANGVQGNRVVGSGTVAFDPTTGAYTDNAFLWENGIGTNLHDQYNLSSLGYAGSVANYVVDDYIFGYGLNTFGEGTLLSFHQGQVQTVDSLLNVPSTSGLSLTGIDRLGNLTFEGFDSSGRFVQHFGYDPNQGLNPNIAYAGPYFGEGFGGTPTLVYFNDFSSNIDGFDRGTPTVEKIGETLNYSTYLLEPVLAGTLGRFSNEAVSLHLDNLVAGEEYSVAASLLIGGTWDGLASGIGPDYFTVTADGRSLFNEAYFYQNPDGLPKSIAFGPSLSGFNGLVAGSTNLAALRFTAQGSTADLVFQAPNSEPVDNEWWTLADVQVTGKRGSGRDVPEPGTLALVLVAGIGVIFRRRR